jgi:hypothetical protein
LAQRHRHVLAAALIAAGAALADVARAGPEDVVLLPTVTAAREAPGSSMILRLPESADGRDVLRWTRRLDMTLREAVQDLGLTLDVSERPSARTPDLNEDALVERARESWVISPRLEPIEGKMRLRIVGVAPGSKVLLVRTQELEPRELELRAMVMMRDLVLAGRGMGSTNVERPGSVQPGEGRIAEPARSPGRAVLALNSAAFGGYVGFSIQGSSQTNDPRLTYPLIALGTGVGLGGSMIIADEWDVGLGDAWYLSAGAWWPTAAGFLLADGYDVERGDDRHLYGLLGATAGLTLATVSLTFKGMSEGGALLAHSGGAFGMLLGGLAELAIEEDDTEVQTPTRGMGYGTGAGVIVAGALATQVSVTPSRVLLVDLGASLGALTAAAAASPLLLVDEETSEEGRSRAWFLSVAAGTLIGGGLGWWITRPSETGQSPARSSLAYIPFAGVIGESPTPGGRRQPVFGAGLRGAF